MMVSSLRKSGFIPTFVSAICTVALLRYFFVFLLGPAVDRLPSLWGELLLPLGVCTIIATIVALVVARFNNVSFFALPSKMVWWMGVFFIPVVIDRVLLRGTEASLPFLRFGSVNAAIYDWLTLGLARRGLFTWGESILLLGVMSWCLFRYAKHQVKTIGLVLATGWGIAFIGIIPSLIAATRVSASGAAFASVQALERSVSLWMAHGYWWNNVADRFPLLGASLANAATELFFVALVWFGVMIVASIYIKRRLGITFDRIVWLVRYGRWGWAFFPVFSGWLLGGPSFTGQWIPSLLAWALFIGAVKYVAWMAFLENQERDALVDEGRHPQAPLFFFQWNPGELRDVLRVIEGLFYGLILLLGAPVALSLALARIARTLYEDASGEGKRRWEGRFILFTGEAFGLLAAGWFFARGWTEGGLRLPVIWLVLVAAWFGWAALLKDWKDAEVDHLAGYDTLARESAGDRIWLSGAGILMFLQVFAAGSGWKEIGLVSLVFGAAIWLFFRDRTPRGVRFLRYLSWGYPVFLAMTAAYYTFLP